MNKVYFHSHAFRFRRFTHKAYAAFASMHRHVTIGRVGRAICDLELLKSGKAILASVLLLFGVSALADEAVPPDETDVANSIALEQLEVVATASRLSSSAVRQVVTLSQSEIRQLPVSSLAEVLRHIAGVDVRERGATGVQADLSLSGCTADQTLVFLNGVNITDPQTGHYSMNIPVEPQDIERIEVYSATPQGLGAYAGVVNIITRRSRDTLPEVDVSLSAGEYGLFAPRVAYRDARDDMHWETAVSYNQSTGFAANTDYRIANAFAHLTSRAFEAQVGAQYKDAGANAFYALSYPDQFDATRVAFASLAYHGRFADRWLLDGTVAYRVHYDRFELFRDGTQPPSWYTGHNRHWTHTADADLKLSYMESWGTTSLGATLRNAYITSNTLGEHNRLTLNYYLQQTVHWQKVSLALLAGGAYNTAFPVDWSYSVDVSYHPLRDLAFYFNTARALRLPTFTDLYYRSATQQGNDGLRAEHAYKAELAALYTKPWHTARLDAQVRGYYRYGTDVIDWVKLPEAVQWSARNHTQLHTWGVDVSVGVTAQQQPLGQFLRAVRVSYAYCDMTKQPTEELSKYALDYLRHRVTFLLEHSIYRGLGASWQLSYRQRNGAYTDREGVVQTYQPVWLLDGSLFYQARAWRASIECTNITNRTYYDYGGILQPAHWLRAKLQINL